MRSGVNGVIDSTPGGDDFIITTATTSDVYAGPNLFCETTLAPGSDDVLVIPSGSNLPSDLDGDTLDDRTVGTVQQQAGTLMHEFGHNLNLLHGGNEDINFKPNYLSNMNYQFQFGIPPSDPDGSGPMMLKLDYSRVALATLCEGSFFNLNTPPTVCLGLDENVGINDGTDSTTYFCPNGISRTVPGTGSIDWNCSGGMPETLVTANINGDAAGATSPLSSALHGFEDWNNLLYDFQNSDEFEEGMHMSPDPQEADYITYLETLSIDLEIDIKPGSFPNSINIKSKGIVPVAILGSANFDVTDVDVTSLVFGPSGAAPAHDLTNPALHLEDVNLDGFTDLVSHYVQKETGLASGDTEACLMGETLGGTPLNACDSVKVK